MERREIYNALSVHLQKIQKNEIGININLLKTNRGQSLITRFVPSFHHNVAQAVQPPLPSPESTPLPMSAEPAGAFHRDESEKRNQKRHFPFQKIQT